MSLEEKCYFFSGKDFWESRSLKRLGIEGMTMADGPHGIRKQEGAGDQLGLNGSLPATCFPTWARKSGGRWARKPRRRTCAFCWAPA